MKESNDRAWHSSDETPGIFRLTDTLHKTQNALKLSGLEFETRSNLSIITIKPLSIQESFEAEELSHCEITSSNPAAKNET